MVDTPPGHEKHWNKHCHEYGACGRPVYFVRDGWYNDVYAPRYRQTASAGVYAPPQMKGLHTALTPSKALPRRIASIWSATVAGRHCPVGRS